MNSTQSYWPNSIFRVAPAAKRIGLTSVSVAYVSSHVRHDLERNGEPERHSGIVASCNLKVTMDTYVQAVSDEKRKARVRVVEMIMPGNRKAARYLNGRLVVAR